VFTGAAIAEPARTETATTTNDEIFAFRDISLSS
jgi:hypothetical protein